MSHLPETYSILDVETPNRKSDSLCSIALLSIKNGKIIKEINQLINPKTYFDNINISIHGITPNMVSNQPTFDKFWNELEPYLSNDLIVAHNASFDLNVICKLLKRYHIEVPKIQYICTYNIAKSLVKKDERLQKYSLDCLCNRFNIKFENHHDAFYDSMACYELLLSLQKEYNFSVSEYAKAYQLKDTKNSVSKKIVAIAFAKLEGLIDGICIDNEINLLELNVINKWMDEYIECQPVFPFQVVFEELNNIIASSDIICSMFDYVKSVINYYLNYSQSESHAASIQTFKALAEGILADNVLTCIEIENMKSWLDQNQQLVGNFPVDKIYAYCKEILEDNIIDEEEHNNIFNMLKSFISPLEENTIPDCNAAFSFENKVFCLSGNFNTTSKSEASELIESKGGICKDTITKKTDYLIVGGAGNSAWKFGNYGTKVTKALQMQENGHPIVILKEGDMSDLF